MAYEHRRSQPEMVMRRLLGLLCLTDGGGMGALTINDYSLRERFQSGEPAARDARALLDTY